MKAFEQHCQAQAAVMAAAFVQLKPRMYMSRMMTRCMVRRISVMLPSMSETLCMASEWQPCAWLKLEPGSDVGWI